MADLTITPLGDCARWSLRLPPALAQCTSELAGFRIALDINRGARLGDRLSARLGPDEWLLCALPEAAADIMRTAAAKLAKEHHSLVDVSHRYAAFSAEGPQAHVLLAAGCPLDLDPSAFAVGTATRTLLGKAEIILWRLHEVTAYRVECARSFGSYVRDFLQETAREWRVMPTRNLSK